VGKRGFYAEVQYQNRQAAMRREQQERAQQRAHASAVREYERAYKEWERQVAAHARATEQERKAAERAAAAALIEARQAEAASMTTDLENIYAQIDSLLSATLEVDDFVDLEALKVADVEPPPFEPGVLGVPHPEVPALVLEPEPTPPSPAKSGGLFGGKKRAAEAAAQQEQYEAGLRDWRSRGEALRLTHQDAVQRRNEAEQSRLAELQAAQKAYHADFQAGLEARREELQQLINNLAFDVESAIEQYIEIVLANSVYPDCFPVEHDASFQIEDRELRLSVTIPPPDRLPVVKEFKYNKSQDQIVEVGLPVSQVKERYASAAHQTAVRTLHEVFEADRAAKVRSISLTVQTSRINPGTGRPEHVPLVVVAADRETFGEFDLSNVVPLATLETLGAAVSKKPYDLIAADTARGVRGRGTV
jgi:restriction system protein